MIGLPFERSAEDILKNLGFLIDIDPDYAQICILSLYPNTEVYDMAVRKILVKEHRWRAFSLNPNSDFEVDHWNQFLSTQKLVSLQKQAYLKFYLRPSHILKSIFSTRTPYEFLTKTKGFLKLLSG